MGETTSTPIKEYTENNLNTEFVRQYSFNITILFASLIVEYPQFKAIARKWKTLT